MLKINFYEVDKADRRFLNKSLRNKFVLSYFNEPLTEENIAAAKDADIISVFIYSVLDRKNLAELSKLKLIATRSTGFNHIDLKFASSKRITVSNVPYYGENTVAEHTLA